MAEPKERRTVPRQQAYLAAEIVSGGHAGHIAVTKDISMRGLLLLTRARLEEGQSVTLKIHRPGDEDRPLTVTGKVVRRQPLRAEETGTWREKVAFEFDEPQSELAEEFTALAKRQAHLLAPE